MVKKSLFLVVVFALSIYVGYLAVQESAVKEKENATLPPASQVEQENSIRETIKKMSLEEKVGQLVIVGADGYEINAHVEELIKEYHVGGFVLFKKNIKDARQLLDLLNALKETNAVNKIPLFLSVDEEGGSISRMPDEFMKMPTSQQIGEINSKSLSYQVGSIIGEELESFGFNMDFAPVLDINSNPDNPVIGDRAFGANENVVKELGIQTMEGLRSQNIIPVVKHFPGHGDTSVDSHVGLPRVNHDIDRLKNFELVPFAAGIKKEVEAVMVAHILLPKIDPNYPASFSRTIITDILRTDMKYDGVVVTDDMTMGAVLNNYEIGTAAVESIKAGSDIVLVCHGYENEKTVPKAIKQAVESGAIPQERIDQSVYRILRLKQKYHLTDEITEFPVVQRINDRIRGLYKDFPALTS